METAIGRVSSVHGDIITVVVDAPVACRRCAAGNGCGAGLLGSTDAERRLDVAAPANLSVDVGDKVTLTLAPRSLLRAAAIAYGLPLFSLVAAASLAWLSGADPDSLAAIVIVAIGLVTGVTISRVLLNRGSACQEFIPAIEGRLRPSQ